MAVYVATLLYLVAMFRMYEVYDFILGEHMAPEVPGRFLVSTMVVFWPVIELLALVDQFISERNSK